MCSPHRRALSLDDRRLIKMVLETAQLLSTAISELGGVGPYKLTHRLGAGVVGKRGVAPGSFRGA